LFLPLAAKNTSQIMKIQKKNRRNVVKKPTK